MTVSGGDAVLATERLRVRRWRPDDAAFVLDLLGRDDVARWTSQPEPLTSLDQARERLGRWQATGEGHPGLGSWAITLRGRDEPIGLLLLRRLQDPEDLEVGWTLHPDHWGNGYATEAARAAIDRAWQFGHPSVVAIMWPDNHRSAAVAARIGMTDLGDVPDPWYGTDDEPNSRIFRIDRPDDVQADEGGDEGGDEGADGSA